MDVLTVEQRHRCMASIKGKDTRPEQMVRKFLHSRGFRYRLHVKALPGKPDIVLRKYRTVIFVNGCFWHGHEGCRYFVLPKTHVDFWRSKIEKNRSRDQKERIELRDLGWHVVQVWECQLKPGERENTLKDLERLLYTLFLDNHRKAYPEEQSVEASMAAEGTALYSKELNPK